MPFRISSLLFLLLSLGCVGIPLPSSFLPIVDEPGDFRAVTADEAKVWVRQFTVSEGGDLAFWQAALERDFIDNRGYVEVDKKVVKDAKGRDLALMTFDTRAGGLLHRYLIGVSAKPGAFGTVIHVSEYVATKKVFPIYKEAVERAIRGIK